MLTPTGVWPDAFDAPEEIPARRVVTKSESVFWIEDTWLSNDRMRLQRQSDPVDEPLNDSTYSSPGSPPMVDLPGFSMIHSKPLFLQRLHGGSSAPTQRIFIRRQLFCGKISIMEWPSNVSTYTSSYWLLVSNAGEVSCVKRLTIHPIDRAPFLFAILAVVLTLAISPTLFSCVEIRLVVGIVPVVVRVWLHGDGSANDWLTIRPNVL